MKILVTGAAGFIGFHLVSMLAKRGDSVVGLDSINDYYDVNLKYARLLETGIEQKEIESNKLVCSTKYSNYKFIKLDLLERDNLVNLFVSEEFDVVVNLAAQAGVRYSIDNPYAYIDSNISGFINLLECVRHHSINYFIYASSSSVYGENSKVPFSEKDKVDNPVSLYAATKRANELMASVYSKLYGINTIGLRFFTVYGPWGRPDMAPMLFAKAILNSTPIKIFNNGELSRDFTYIDDIIDGVVCLIDKFEPNLGTNNQTIKSELYNIGCGQPMKLMDFVQTVEQAFGKEVEKIMMPMQPGDVYVTYADTTKLEMRFGYKAKTSLKDGIIEFAKWYIKHY